MSVLLRRHTFLVLLFSLLYLSGSSAFAHPPTGIAVDEHGNVYFVDVVSNSIFKVSTSGKVSVVAKLAGFPHSLALDARGNLYVGEYDSNRVLKITPDDEIRILATVECPSALAVDKAGNVYVCQDRKNVITRISPDGTTNRLVEISSPRGIAIDTLGNVFVTADRNKVLKISRNRKITVIADGLGTPWGIALDKRGNICVAEYSQHRVSQILPQEEKQSIRTLARLDTPSGVACAMDGDVYVLDGWEKPCNSPKIYVHRINGNGVVTTLVGDR